MVDQRMWPFSMAATAKVEIEEGEGLDLILLALFKKSKSPFIEQG